MFGIERLQMIRELIIEQKSVEVTTLSKDLGVSEVTIRRDLDKLEKEGLVIKTYGGAILLEELPGSGKEEQSTQTVNQKQSDSIVDGIAEMAGKTVDDNDTVFIDGSELGLALAANLKDHKDLIIVTNNLEIAIYIHRETEHKVVMIGGEVDEETGDVTDYDQLMDLLVEKAFVSVDGIELTVGYTADDKQRMRLFKVLKSVSREMIVMTKSDAFYKRGLVRVAPIETISTVITDVKIPDEFKTFYYENNIKVHSSTLMKL